MERVFELSRLSILKFQVDAISDAHLNLARYSEIYEPSDVEDWRKQLSAELRETIPTAFNSMSIFLLSAAYEQSLKDLARYVARRDHHGSAPPRAERNPLEFLRKRPVAEVDPTAETRVDLDRLKLIRDALAHADGYLFSESDARRQELLRVVDANVGVSLERTRLVPSERFLLQSLSAVVVHLSQVMKAVTDAFTMRPRPGRNAAS